MRVLDEQGSVPRWWLVLAIAVLGPGCLPEAVGPPDARLLYAGRDMENIRIESLADGEWVNLEVRNAARTTTMGGKLDVHFVRWADGLHRMVIANRAERDEWPVIRDAEQIRYYMTDERLEPAAPGASALLPVGTLVRVSLNSGVVDNIRDVTGYGLDPEGRRILYRKYVPGSALPDLYVRDLQGRERRLGRVSGAAQFFGAEAIYFVGEDDSTLIRVPGFEGEPKRIRSRVSRFVLRGDERIAILTVSEMGQVRTLIHDLQTGTETMLPVENPCCWLGLDGNTFTFAEAARTGSPARIHDFDFIAKTDKTLDMPEGLADVVSRVGRPGHQETWIFDSRRRFAIYRPSGEPRMRLAPLRPTAPEFTADGKYLLYIEPEPPTPGLEPSEPAGKLMVQDADFASEPYVLSPHGASVPIGPPAGYFQTGAMPFSLVFWAHYGRSASDLYFANHVDRTVQRVAEAISEITVTQRRVIGIVRVSLQDLSGDLVQKDLTTGKEEVLGNGVTNMTINGNKVAFVIRDRSPSKRDGLWATTLR